MAEYERHRAWQHFLPANLWAKLSVNEKSPLHPAIVAMNWITSSILTIALPMLGAYNIWGNTANGAKANRKILERRGLKAHIHIRKSKGTPMSE